MLGWLKHTRLLHGRALGRQGIVLTVRIPCRAMPMDGGRCFADPLDSALGAIGLGKVVAPPRPVFQGSSDLAFEIELCALNQAAIELVAQTLEMAQVPEGSALLDGRGRVLRRFGHAQVVALRLGAAGIVAPGEAVLAQFCEALDGRARLARAGDGAIAFIGPCEGALEEALRPVLAGSPDLAEAELRRLG